MVRSTALSLAWFLIVLPTVAAGQIIAVNVEDRDVIPAPGGGRITLDVTVQDVSPRPFHDDLRAYDLPFLLERVGGGPSDLRFVPPYAERPESPVLTGPRTVYMVQTGASSSSFTVEVFDPDATLVDVPTDPIGAARLVLEYGPATPPGEYRIRLDPDFTIFAGGPDGPEVYFAKVSDVGGIVRIVPEPASALPLTVCSLLAFGVRRRRRPSQVGRHGQNGIADIIAVR
jgi:hypothetical protein